MQIDKSKYSFIKYKYVIAKSGESDADFAASVTWEQGSNRKIVLPLSSYSKTQSIAIGIPPKRKTNHFRRSMGTAKGEVELAIRIQIA